MDDSDDPKLYFGNLKPKEERMSEGYNLQEAQSFEISNRQFSVGFQLDWNGKDRTPENAMELYEEQNLEYEKKPLHHLIEDVNAGDLILVAPYGKKSNLRYIGRFTNDPWQYGTEEHEKMDVVNYRRVEEWVAVDRNELPTQLYDYSAQQVLVNCRAASKEDIEELGRLYREKRVEQQAKGRYQEEARGELYLGEVKVADISKMYFTRQKHTIEVFEGEPGNVVKTLRPVRGAIIEAVPTEHGLDTFGEGIIRHTIVSGMDSGRLKIYREDGSELELPGVRFKESIDFKDADSLTETLKGRQFMCLSSVEENE
ncbi:MAG: hypothetical protein ACI9LV_000099 [Candidatus Nanohaloarchaea archaeon]|jgi:hypothetical protein